MPPGAEIGSTDSVNRCGVRCHRRDLLVGLGLTPGCSRTAGVTKCLAYRYRLAGRSDGTAAYGCRISGVSPRVSTEDLLDAQGVADVLGLSQRNTVFQYQRRYEDMPRPVLDLGEGRVKLWLRPEMERWWTAQVSRGRTRPVRRRSG